jgi:hypothetical protein
MPHNHKCSCEHKEVKYCSCCYVVFCKDCNQEWSAKVNFDYTWTTPYLGQRLPNELSVTSGSTQGLGPVLSTTSCGHTK